MADEKGATVTASPARAPEGGERYLAGLGVGICFFLVCVGIAIFVEKSTPQVLLCLFGGALGWFIGILISPTSKGQEEQFKGYARAISALISGFLLAKLDQFLEPVVKASADSLVTWIVPSLLFGTCFLVGLLCTFAGRDFGAARHANQSAKKGMTGG
jgi:hypothetical protein